MLKWQKEKRKNIEKRKNVDGELFLIACRQNHSYVQSRDNPIKRFYNLSQNLQYAEFELEKLLLKLFHLFFGI